MEAKYLRTGETLFLVSNQEYDYTIKGNLHDEPLNQ